MVQELEDIEGLGKTTAKKMRDAGIETIDELSRTDPEEVELDGISEERLRGFVNEAKRAGVIIQTGTEVVDEFRNLPKVPTGIDKLDEILGGGWEAGYLIAIAGETGSGKTQVSFQALGEAVKSRGKPGIYIETERGRYRGNRVIEMYDEDVQSQVYKIGAYDLDQQELAYDKILDQFETGDLSCVVVDSFTARFRMSDKFSGREDLPTRADIMGRHLDKLDQIAARFEIPILLVCQVSANPTQYGAKYNVYGGTLMHHMVNFIIMMKNRTGALCDATIQNHPEVEEKVLELRIVSEGVEYVGAD